MFSAFLLSANSRQSNANFFESIWRYLRPRALKDKAWNCEWPRPLPAGPMPESPAPLGPARESEKKRVLMETPAENGRESRRVEPRLLRRGAGWQRIRRGGRVRRPP